MRRFLSPLLVASLVALHATVMLVGPGLHGLAAWDHAARHFECANREHAHGPAHAAAVDSDDCPVCHFFAQGHVPITTAPVLTALQSLTLRPEPRSRLVTPQRLHSISPRAPPTTPLRFDA